ncbi:hypothetical protein [Nocardioides immobilis]|nr:hypothetical protein [Nocardioides immobilis]
MTSEELAEVKELKAKVRRLEEDNEILRRASIFFAGSSTPATADRRVHQRAAGRGPRGRVDLPFLGEQGCQIAVSMAMLRSPLVAN